MTKEDEKPEVIPANLILYIGEDLSYFADLEAKYKEIYPSSSAVFSSYNRKGDSQIQSLILEIRRLRPKLIFIDYSTETAAKLHITRVWVRQNFHANVAFIGLCDYAKEVTNIKKSIMTNIKCVHVKSSEFEAICFDIHILAFTDKVENHGFATAKLSESFPIFLPCKITNINLKDLRIESNIDLSGATDISMSSFLTNSKVLHTQNAKVLRQERENLYYNYDFAQYIEPIFDLEVVKTDDMNNTQFNEKQTRNNELANLSRSKLRKWVADHQNESSPKFIKTLIVDKTDALFDSRPMSDSFPTVFRTQAYLKDTKQELLKIKPHIIVFHLEKVSEEELKLDEDIAYTFNTGAALLKIIQVIQNRGEDYSPYIIVFNTEDKSTEDLQEAFKFKNIIAVKEPIDIDIVVQMCDLFRKKIEPQLLKNHNLSQSVYLKKNDVRTYVEVQSEVTVKALSETDIYFDSDQIIPEGTVFRITINHHILVTVMPMPAFANIEAGYFGIIHGIGEIERQGLRQFINNIFFTDLQAKKAQEAHDVAEQKRKFLEAREAEKKKAEELAEAEAKQKLEEEAKAQEDKNKDE